MIATQRETAGDGSGNAAARGTADWLSLAGAPTFAFMALLTGLLDAGPPDICSAAHHASPLNGMVAMYGLMSAFHAAPWPKLISSRRSDPSKRRQHRATHGRKLRQYADRCPPSGGYALDKVCLSTRRGDWL